MALVILNFGVRWDG